MSPVTQEDTKSKLKTPTDASFYWSDCQTFFTKKKKKSRMNNSFTCFCSFGVIFEAKYEEERKKKRAKFGCSVAQWTVGLTTEGEQTSALLCPFGVSMGEADPGSVNLYAPSW